MSKYFNGVEVEDLEDGEVIIKNYDDCRSPKEAEAIVILIASIVGIIILCLMALLIQEPRTEKNTVSSDFANKTAYKVIYIKPKAIQPKKAPLIGNWNDYVKTYSETLKIDYKIPLAIMKYETGHFKSNAFLNKNNPCGYMTWSNGNRSLKIFSTKEIGIKTCIDNLKNNYINKGLDTFAEIQSKYAPTSDGNSYWLSSVRSIYNEL